MKPTPLIFHETSPMEMLAQGAAIVMVVNLARAGLYLQALLVALFCGYVLFRIHWAHRLERTYRSLAQALAASEKHHRGNEDGLLEDLAVLSVAAYEAAARRYWVSRWPFAGVFFRHVPLPACSCGGTQLFVERNVQRPPFPAVCMRCGQGARNSFERELAHAGRRWAEQRGIEV